ncbi:unnamed protein product [Alternaria alternata]
MHLPNEVHDLIISDLEPRERFNYRLIGHSFAQAAIPHVFRRINVSPVVSSLRDLAHIASQKHLNRHVTHLGWDSDRLRLGKKKGQIDLGDKQWEAVREILPRDANESEHHGDIGMRILTLILRHFPNLKTLDIDIWESSDTTERCLDPSDSSSMIRGEYEMYTLLTAAHAVGCQITEFKLSSVGRPHPLFRSEIWPSLVPVCKDLTSLKLPLNFALSVEEKETWLREYKEIEDQIPEDERTTMFTGYTTVHSFHSTAAQIASFRAFLSTLSKLQTLELTLKAEQWDEHVDMDAHLSLQGPSLEDVLPSNAFPHLRTLVLDHPNTSTACLKSVLTKHKETLEVAKFTNVAPWKKFTHRQEAKHRPEDDLRLCTLDQTSAQVIERFLSPERDKIHLDELIPRRRQVLRDFLNGVHPEGILGMGSCLQDVKDRSNDDNIIALVDDRQNHERCDKIIGKPYTYFGSEEKHKTYFTGCQEGDGFDPPVGGRFRMTTPRFDPREYFLLKLRFWTEQAVTEYSALIETFNSRMDEYARTIRRVFEDDNKRTNTRTISDVIETAQLFIDGISGITDAWDTFSRTELVIFTTYLPERSTWPTYINIIIRNVAELDRLRKLLLIRRDHFKFKLDSLHTVSSLSQTYTGNLQAETAVNQGNDLKILTKMTVTEVPMGCVLRSVSADIVGELYDCFAAELKESVDEV